MTDNSFTENFDGKELNAQLWWRPTWENGVPNNVTVSGGLLRCLVDSPKTSASIASKIQYGYGTYTVRMKFPDTDQNLRGAFWLKDNTYGGEEIDIEYYGYMPNSIDLTIYVSPGETQLATKRVDVGYNLATDFHEWRIDYLPGKIIYYLDNIEIWRVEDPRNPTRQMMIRAKADNPSWRPDNTNSGYTLVDYIIYNNNIPVQKWKCTGAPNYICIQTSDTIGTLYDTQAECQDACTAPLGSITVMSPSSGAIYRKKESIVIKWTYTGNVVHTVSNVKIDLLKAGHAVKTITNSTPNDGEFTWTIHTVTTGSDYQIKVASKINVNIFGISGKFSIR